MKLIKLTKDYKEQLIEMYDEWTKDQIENHTNHSPWAIFKNNPHEDFDSYIAHLDDKGGANLVPSTTLFYYDEEHNKFIGAVNIRHRLNEGLLKTGGHIGDGIRPSERKKGHATRMIALALIECKKLGIDKVLMVCDKDNIGSAKSIINNGGILENEIVGPEGKVEQRYWITI